MQANDEVDMNPAHEFVPSDDPAFGSAIGGGCGALVLWRAHGRMILCGFPREAHVSRETSVLPCSDPDCPGVPVPSRSVDEISPTVTAFFSAPGTHGHPALSSFPLPAAPVGD